VTRDRRAPTLIRPAMTLSALGALSTLPVLLARHDLAGQGPLPAAGAAKRKWPIGPRSTIGAFEIKDETARLSKRINRMLIEAFERAGLQFIPENGGGPGVRFRDPIGDQGQCR
jgi:hypothetical protein